MKFETPISMACGARTLAGIDGFSAANGASVEIWHMCQADYGEDILDTFRQHTSLGSILTHRGNPEGKCIPPEHVPALLEMAGAYTLEAHSRTNEAIVEIAQRTGGEYYKATDPESLERVFREIDRLEKTPLHVKRYVRYREAFPPLVWAGLGFLLLPFAAAGARITAEPCSSPIPVSSGWPWRSPPRSQCWRCSSGGGGSRRTRPGPRAGCGTGCSPPIPRSGCAFRSPAWPSPPWALRSPWPDCVITAEGCEA